MKEKIEIFVDFEGFYQNQILNLLIDLNHNLNKWEFIDWKYNKNPGGDAIVAVALNSRKEIVGQQVYLPRIYRFRDLKFVVVEAVDAVVHPDYRRKGIYQNIWTETRKMLMDKRMRLTTFPSISGMSIGAMKKEGLFQLGLMKQYFCILRLGIIIQKRKHFNFLLKNKKVYNSLNGILKFYFRKRNKKVITKPVKKFCDSEFCHYDRIQLLRSREYLNWRFVDNPVDKFLIFKFYMDSEDIGYAVLKRQKGKNSLFIYDFIARKYAKNCLKSLIDYIYEMYQEIGIVFYKALEKNPYHYIFLQCGFLPMRNDHIMFTSNFKLNKLSNRKEQWFVTLSDTDW
jgi:hypothetical protein